MADNLVTGAVDAAKAVAGRPRPGGPRPTHPSAVARRPRPSLVLAAPSIARVAAVSAFNAVSWGIGASIAGANYLTRRALEGQPTAAIVQEAANDLRGAALRALGVQMDGVPNVSLGLTIGGAAQDRRPPARAPTRGPPKRGGGVEGRGHRRP